ncbi:MAG: hypothetical protein ABR867_04660 [Nitrososphaerales archaeon]
MELKEAEARLETAREDLKRLQEEQEWEKQGGRNLNLPEYTWETVSKLPPKKANQVARLLLYLQLHGRKSGNELLQATISFDSEFPPLARYTDEEVFGYLNRLLDVVNKRPDSMRT